MAIPVTCPHCRENFRIKEKYAGRAGACPACHGPLQVPEVNEAPASPIDAGDDANDLSAASSTATSVATTRVPRDEATNGQRQPVDQPQPVSKSQSGERAQRGTPTQPAAQAQPRAQSPPIPAHNSGPDRYRWFCEARCTDPRAMAQELTAVLADQSFRPRVPLRYRLYSVLLTAWVIAMPLVYLAIVAAVLAGTLSLPYFAMQANPQELQRAGAKGLLAMILVVLGGLFACFLMIRPLFVRAPRAERPPGLDRQEAPLLFLLVERICASLGAVQPKAIYVDMGVNAAAGMGDTWRAMWRSEYTLSLGLPLVAGLTTSQLAGIIAHELGHFNQSLGCRLSFLVYRIQMWFAQVVFEPDPLDDWLKQQSEGHLGSYVSLARLPTYVVRKTLKLLMRGTLLANNALSRQQEFDADQSMSWIVGSAEFPQLVRRIATLGAADGVLDDQINRCLTDEIIFDDYPQLVVALADRLNAESSAKVAHELADRTRSLVASHPPMAERIDRAALVERPAVLPVAEPAAMLFADFGATARSATAAVLSGYGWKVTPRPTTQFVSWLDHWRELDAVQSRFYRFAWHQFEAKQLAATATSPGATAERVARLGELRQQLLANDRKYLHWIDKRDLLERDLAHLQLARSILAYTQAPEIEVPELQRTFRSPPEAAAALADVQQKWDEADAAMSQTRGLDAERLRLALDLLGDPAVRRRVANGDELARRAKSYYALAAHLDRQMPTVRALWRQMYALKQHFAYLQRDLARRSEGGESPAVLSNFYGPLIAWTQQEALALHGQLRALRHALGEMPYPFEHGRPGLSISQFATESLPEEQSPGVVIETAWGVLMSVNFMHSRALAELAWIAEQIESAVGLERLPTIEKHPPPAAPALPVPWYQRHVPWLTVSKLCLLLGSLLVLSGLVTMMLGVGAPAILIALGSFLIIGAILEMA